MDSPSTTFFSYSRVNSEFVLRLAKDLRAAGAKVWLDQLDIGPGQRWDNAVQEALRRCPSQIVVLSPDSVSSENVMDEVSYALEEHKQVIPVLYRECEMPFRLRRVQYIDFRADYQRGLSDLLKALGVPAPADPTPIQLSKTQPTPQPLTASPEQAAGAEPAREFVAQEKISAPSQRERSIGALAGAGLGILGCLLVTKGQLGKGWISEGGFYPITAAAIAGMIAGFRRTVIQTSLAVGILGWLVGYVVWHDMNSGHPSGSAAIGFGIGFTPGIVLGAIVGAVYLKIVSKKKR